MDKYDFSKVAGWLDGHGQFSDIILSSRIRIYRNLEDKKFVPWSNNRELQDMTDNLLEVFSLSGYFKDAYQFKFPPDTGKPDNDLFVERFLVNLKFITSSHPKGLVVGDRELISALINNNDHLNIQVYQSGLNLDDNFLLITKLEEELEKYVNFSFSEQFGYLTAMPTLAGTGMRASFIIHLPAVMRMGEIESIMKILSKIRCNFTSLFGHGPQVVQGDLFIISNQITLGVTEEEIIDTLSRIAMEILNYERTAREKLFRLKKNEVEDDIFRSYGILQNARAITFNEVISYLSMLRLGRSMELITDIDIKTINRLMVILQPQHLIKLFSKKYDTSDQDVIRAKVLREEL